jgi:hypothetical protein
MIHAKNKNKNKNLTNITRTYKYINYHKVSYYYKPYQFIHLNYVTFNKYLSD